VIFFGSGRLLLFPLLVFALPPLLFYSPTLAFVVVGVAVVVLVTGSRGRRANVDPGPELPTLSRARSVPFEDVKRTAKEDILALADDIRSLDIDIELPTATAAARDDYARALDRYDEAKDAFNRARAPEDFEAVSAAVEQGRFDIVSAKARLVGREPPERRPPCFFDPRHGPSVRDVDWAPPGGTIRPVPACAADAIAIEEGHEPRARQVHVGDQQVPYWNAPAYYGPWAGGFFSPLGAALPTLLIGSALGAGLLPTDVAYDESGGSFTDGGDTAARF
jgi:hypothetical protein